MTREWRTYHYTMIRPRGVDSRHRDGRAAMQVRAVVRARSTAEALRLFELPRSQAPWVGPGGDVAGLEDGGPVLVAPLDPGDTIDGTTGFRPLGGQQEPDTVPSATAPVDRQNQGTPGPNRNDGAT